MQVSLSEKILSNLAGSSSARPVIECDLFKLGRKSDVARELNTLDLARKIIRCKITRYGESTELIYLSGQIVGPGKLSLHNLSSGKAVAQEKLKYCKGCDKDLPRQVFSKYAHKCMTCEKSSPKVCKQTGKGRGVGTRLCIICKTQHPYSAFIGKSRMCLDTKDQHAEYKQSLQSKRQRAYSKRVKERIGQGQAPDPARRISSRKGVTLSDETRAKIAASQKAAHQRRANNVSK